MLIQALTGPLLGPAGVGSARPRPLNCVESHHNVSQGIPLETGDIHGQQPTPICSAWFAFASRGGLAHDHHLAAAAVLEVLEGRALLATFTVKSLGNLGTGSGDSGDLPYCINQANANNQANTIVFDSTLFSTPQTIDSGPLELKDTGGTQTITGPAAGVTIGLSPTGLQVDAGVTASISGLTLAGGVGVGNSGRGYGGALANYGTATVTGCTISNSGVYNSSTGNLTLSDCTENGNDAVGDVQFRHGQPDSALAPSAATTESSAAACTIPARPT